MAPSYFPKLRSEAPLSTKSNRLLFFLVLPASLQGSLRVLFLIFFSFIYQEETRDTTYHDVSLAVHFLLYHYNLAPLAYLATTKPR